MNDSVLEVSHLFIGIWPRHGTEGMEILILNIGAVYLPLRCKRILLVFDFLAAKRLLK
jgi:hypothetical protein